jgi:murein DD-endopeptidase MepM/ murein hydrolase activator NlpD
MRAKLMESATNRNAKIALGLLCAVLLAGCETAPTNGWNEANSWQHDRATYLTVIVRKGDTVSTIADRYNVSDEVLERQNDLPPYVTLYPGDVLHVPASDGARRAVMRDATNERGGYAPATDRDREIAHDDPAIAPRAIGPNDRVVVRQEPAITPRYRPDYSTPAPVQSGERLSASSGDGEFRAPVSGRIIEGFGSTGNGQRNDGINIAAPAGTPIHAAADGVVTYAGNELKGYGNLILIKHDGDMVTAYAHANSIGVARGQHVSRGDVIGTVGQTGDVDQPQLHFEVRSGMKPVDPRGLLLASSS